MTAVRQGRDEQDGLNGLTRRSYLLVLVAALTAVVLVLTARSQLFDTNFYSLWQATAILAGDHPYRDFFEWGIPLQVGVSTAMQVVVGRRLIGEFLIHWSFIVVGVTIAFHLSLWLSRSKPAALATTVITLVVVAMTATFHYPKLFFYPLAIWLAWRYMDRPTTTRAAMMGLATATAFLFRHDHGVYVGIAATTAFILARLTVPTSRGIHTLLRQAGAFSVTLLLVISPWAALVQSSEGLVEYVTVRAQLYGAISRHSAYFRLPAHLFSIDRDRPLIEITRTPSDLKRDLEQFLRDNPGDESRIAEALNIRQEYADRIRRGDVTLPDRIAVQIAPGIATPNNALAWIFETVVLVPFVSLCVLGWRVARGAFRTHLTSADACRVLLTAFFLIIAEMRILREESYALLFVPLTGVLGSWLLATITRRCVQQQSGDLVARIARISDAARRVLGIAVLLATGVAAAILTKTSRAGLFEPAELPSNVTAAFQVLTASPPIDGVMRADSPARYDPTVWERSMNERAALLMRYFYECTRADDRLLVLGSTPFNIGYHTQRRIAGGHLFWTNAWRSDAEHELQTLTMLQRQSVPFAISTSDPVLDLMAPYPRIRAYLREHYAELSAVTEGRVLVDTRRRPTGTFAPFDLPCFR